MRYAMVVVALGVLSIAFVARAMDPQADPAAKEPAPGEPQWSMNATIIEACSCPMFCQCYFDTKPAAHGGHGGHGDGAGAEHFCKFNNAYQVNKGQWGDVKLDGVKFWLGGDLGGDFSDGEMDWAILTFDPAVTKEQRKAIETILLHAMGVKWGSFTVGEHAPITWEASKDSAHATLDGGKAAEVKLKRFPGMTDEPIVMHNLKYWGALRNDGFIMMPNEVEAMRRAPEGREPYEFKGTNGFMITFDINSDDVKKASEDKEEAKAPAHDADPADPADHASDEG